MVNKPDQKINFPGHLKSPPEMITKLLEIINSGIVVSNLYNKIIFINRKAASIFGSNRSSLKGEDLSTLFMEEDREIFLPNILRMVRTNGEFEGEVMLRKVDGSGFITLLSATSMPIEDRTNIAFTINDISRLKGIEKALQRSQRMLYLGSILDDISHQIRNPVLTIGGFARRLMKTGVKRPEYTEVIMEEAARLELLVTTLTDFTTMPKPRLTRIDSEDLLKNVFKCSEKISEEYEINISTDFQKGLRCDNIMIDRELFTKALENALTNACESNSTMDEKPDVSINIIPANIKNMVCSIQISDNGDGIRDTVLPRVFHPFFTTKTGHIGMGLPFIKQIQEELGGTVSIDSKFSQGTTLTLQLSGDRRREIRKKPL